MFEGEAWTIEGRMFRFHRGKRHRCLEGRYQVFPTDQRDQYVVVLSISRLARSIALPYDAPLTVPRCSPPFPPDQTEDAALPRPRSLPLLLSLSSTFCPSLILSLLSFLPTRSRWANAKASEQWSSMILAASSSSSVLLLQFRILAEDLHSMQKLPSTIRPSIGVIVKAIQ